jgi:hypothetical protein
MEAVIRDVLYNFQQQFISRWQAMMAPPILVEDVWTVPEYQVSANAPSNLIGLNIEPHYGSHRPATSLTELVQNWRDQCYRMADFADPVLDQCSGQVNGVGYEVYILSHPSLPQILGWLTNVFSPDRRKVQVTMTNCDTSIDVTCLRFGNTSKADQPLLAGTFGEGLKGTINRLRRSGAQVFYLTGNCRWRFEYSSSKELVAVVEQLRVPVRHLYVSVQGIPWESRVDPSYFLFIQPPSAPEEILQHPQMIDAGTTKRVRILLSEHRQGEIYLHGIRIPVAESTFFSKIGIDFHGSIVAQMRVSQDRDIVDGVYFGIAVAVTLVDMFDTHRDWPVYQRACALVYESLESDFISRELASHLRCLRKTTKEAGYTFARLMLFMFSMKHGSSTMLAIPVEGRSSDAEKQEATLLQCNLVSVPKNLFHILSEPGDCPTLKRRRQEFAHVYLQLDEFILAEDGAFALPYDFGGALPQISVTIWPAEQAFLPKQLRSIIGGFFGPYVHEMQVRFKNFQSRGAGMNPRAIVPMQDASGRWFYLIDCWKYDINRVHAMMKTDDETFECSGQNCGCLHTQLFYDFLKELAAANPEEFGAGSKSHVLLQKRVQRRLFGLLNPLSMPSSSEAPHISASSSRSSASGTASHDHPADVPSSVRTPGGQGARAPSSTPRTHGQPESAAGNSSKPSETKSVPFETSDLVKRHLTQCVRMSQISGYSQLPSKKEFTMPDESYEQEQEEQKRGCAFDVLNRNELSCQFHRVENAQLSLGFWETATGSIQAVHLDQRSVTFDASKRSEAAKFCACLRFLWKYVYDGSQNEAGFCVLNVYSDNSGLIAFNSESWLFFNVDHFSRQLAQDWSRFECLSYWVVVMAHELAHNVAAGHGKNHESAMEKLLFVAIPRLRDAVNKADRRLQEHRDAGGPPPSDFYAALELFASSV